MRAQVSIINGAMAVLALCLFLSIVAYPSNAVFLASRSQEHPKEHLTVLAKPASNGTWINANAESRVTFNGTCINTTHASTNGTWINAGHSRVAFQAPAKLQQQLPLLKAKQGNNASWGNGVVYFLFLINDNLPHSALWQKFLTGAPQNSWRALVHCKDSEGCARNGVFTNNPGFVQVATTPTWYCHDLVSAMAQLARSALGLTGGATAGQREKFVFLSESTLPIKPFSEIHGTLLLDDVSDICLFPSDQWASSNIDGAFVKMIKHHQWVVLSRPHAEMFVQNWVSVNANSQWRVWLKSGTWDGQSRYVYPQSFYYPARANTCTDEWAFMGTIYGALEPLGGVRFLSGFGGGHVDMNTYATQGQCRTWSYWDNAWDPAATALASQISNDFYGSRMSCYPKCHARPAELEKLSTGSLYALRRSPFLFARKFSSNIWMPSYENIIFGM